MLTSGSLSSIDAFLDTSTLIISSSSAKSSRAKRFLAAIGELAWLSSRFDDAIVSVNSYCPPFFDLLLVFSVDRGFVGGLGRALSRRSSSLNRGSKGGAEASIDLANFGREVRVESLSSFRLRVAEDEWSISSIFLRLALFR